MVLPGPYRARQQEIQIQEKLEGPFKNVFFIVYSE